MVYIAPMVTFTEMRPAMMHMRDVTHKLVEDMHPGKKIHLVVNFSRRKSCARAGVCKRISVNGEFNYTIIYNMWFIEANLGNAAFFMDTPTHESAHTLVWNHDAAFRAVLAQYGVPNGIERPTLPTRCEKSMRPYKAICPVHGELRGTYTQKVASEKRTCKRCHSVVQFVPY